MGTSDRTTATVVSDLETLRSHVDDWDELAAHALEPNPFYGSWLLLPALANLGAPEHLRVVLVWSPPKGPPRKGNAPLLVGLFPLHIAASRRWMPARHLSLVRHDYCFFCAPLVHEDHGAEAVSALFDWFDQSDETRGALDLPQLPGDTALHRLFVDEIGRREWIFEVRSRHSRAVLVPQESAEACLAKVSSKRLKEHRRQRKRLGEQGTLTFETLSAVEDLEPWLDEIVRLERAGWKGRDGTALGCMPSHERFFREAARGARDAGCLAMARLRLDGRSIAMKLDFIARHRAFAFRIAFDESFAQYSPGVLLELDDIEGSFAAGHDMVDSCAKPDHPMINHLWQDRRTIEHLVISSNRTGDAVLSVLPLARLARKMVKQ